MMREDDPLQASTPGARELSPPLVVVLEAPHFQLDKGFKLFENGELTPFLQYRINKLQGCAEDEHRTNELVRLMHEAEILEPAEVDHLGERVECYLVNDKALGAKLDKIGRDKMGQIISLVLAIADSQKKLGVSITTS